MNSKCRRNLNNRNNTSPCLSEIQMVSKENNGYAVINGSKKSTASSKSIPSSVQMKAKTVVSKENPKQSMNLTPTWYEVFQKRDSSSKSIPANKLPMHDHKIIDDEPDRERKKVRKRACLIAETFKSQIKDLSDEDFLILLAACKDLIKNFKSGFRKNSTDKSVERHSKNKSQNGANSIHTSLIDGTEIMVKSMSTLLKSVEETNKRANDQKELLENLTAQISQLRDENAVLSEMKNMKTELEIKLSNCSSENKQLKEKLVNTEKELVESKQLLGTREKHMENLITHMKSLKLAGGEKQKNCEGFTDHSDNLPVMNDYIASVPNHQESFNLLIRPASSSPTHEFNNKIVDDIWLAGRVSPAIKTTTPPPLRKTEKKKGIHKIQENLKRLTEALEADMEKKDISVNLSDTTFHLSMS